MERGGVSSWIVDRAWSPDSSRLIILNSGGQLIIEDLNTDKLTVDKITIVPIPDENHAEATAWSLNGKQIAVLTHDKQYKSNLYIMNADGTNASLIPPLPQETEGAEMVAPDFRISHVFWVP